MRVTQRVKSVAIKTGKSTSTVWRWVKAGCDISSPASINQFLKGNHRKRHHNPNPIRKPTTESVETGSRLVDEPAPDLNLIELGPVGRRGAAAALARLEEIEERAYTRLQRAIEAGNPFQIKACQEFYLRCSETLRRLDLAVETERRTALEQIPLRQIENVSRQISEWLRIAFTQFLSAESPGLMGIKDLGEFKFSAIERFRGILHTVVESSIKTDAPIPEWASTRVIESWNIH